jgi:hypothetical protein
MKNKFLVVLYFIEAYIKNRIAEYLDRRLENKRRYWTAYGTFGSGVTPLGKCSLAQATKKTSKFGTVVFCDVPNASIFYSDKFAH